MKKLPILIFIVLCLTAVATSYGSYCKAQRKIESDLQQALPKTIKKKKKKKRYLFFLHGFEKQTI